MKKAKKTDPFYVKPPSPKERARFDFILQRAFLKVWGIERPLGLGRTPIHRHGDSLTEAVNEVRIALHGLNRGRGLFTQDWMRSALFLRCVALKKKGGYEEVRNAIWAYTAALIDGIEKISSNPALLENAPKGQRFAIYMAMVRDLRKAVEGQMRLLGEIKAAKVEYERTEDVLDFGRLLLRSVHCPDPCDTKFEYRAFVDAIGRYGPGALPDTDWDAAVMIAKAILAFEEKKKERAANAAQETVLKGDENEKVCKCEGGG